jgi:uncharacterized protein (TIGR03083 family)
MAALNFLHHLDRESSRFAEVLRGIPSATRVPSCPAWDADDLLWHLGEVQWFWGTVARERILESAQAEALETARPEDRAGLETFFGEASRSLLDVLTTSPPETAAWTWSSEHTVGFIRRRQAHEALIHRVDAELTAGARTPMDPALSADGVDEILRVMYGGEPPWGRFEPEHRQSLRVTATDTGSSWLLVLGRFTGTDPEDGTTHDEADLRVADVDEGGLAAATISGRASDLDCWLWHRDPVGEVATTGDEAVLGAFETTIGPGIN